MPDTVTVVPSNQLSKVWSINVSGLERHDGEKPYTYALEADSFPEAKLRAWLYHIWYDVSERGTVAVDGTVPGLSDEVNQSLASHWRLDDVVIIDCAEFPCDSGRPFDCADPIHVDSRIADRTSCRCDWCWHWVNWTDHEASIDLDRLRELGYRVPSVAPVEHTW